MSVKRVNIAQSTLVTAPFGGWGVVVKKAETSSSIKCRHIHREYPENDRRIIRGSLKEQRK
jgi:hypothetical protein